MIRFALSLFHAALEDKQVASPFNTYFLLTFLPVLMFFIFLESGRTRSASVWSYAGLAVGCCAQVVTFAVTTPIFWLYFILVAGQHKGGPSQAHAGASVLGMVMGWVVPSLLLITQEQPIVTLLFQPAPIYAFASQIVYSFFIAPQSSKSALGTGVAQVAYVAWFMIAAGIHVNMALSHFTDCEGFSRFFIPTMVLTDAPRAILNIFQWDFIFAVGASVVGTLWFAHGVTEVVGLLIWYPFASVIVGPGAAFSAVALWREGRV
ncbi:hypothetical protein CPB85DRAFT_1248116 [Mucidula mucida]|nr:hypothetical protein CPB85DRAFT_1248116 [Mucidula mucida]